MKTYVYKAEFQLVTLARMIIKKKKGWRGKKERKKRKESQRINGYPEILDAPR